MTKTLIRRFIDGLRLDDVLAAGGQFVLCTEDGTVEHDPLVPALGAEVTVRGRYRCRTCGAPAGELLEYTAEATGQRCLLVGRDGAGGTRHTFLEPDLGAEPVVDCAKHGELAVERAALLSEADRSRRIQTSRRRRVDTERATRNVKFPPRHAGPLT